MILLLPFLLLLSVFRTVLETMGLQGKVKPQQARNKWDHLENKYKVGAGLNDDVETKLYLFYPCKSINNFLNVADVTALGLLITRDRKGGQREAQRCH